jgi:hypothetical protein
MNSRIVLPTLIALAAGAVHAEEAKPWPAPVPNFKPPASGEHPRLFFRQGDIPALRERAKTPEGRAILKRLRVQLNGSDGESIPTDKRWTISTVAGFGFLYLVTGDAKYAALGRASMEKQSFAGVKDYTDSRYAFKGPDGALRAGPALGWGALGYDLCYDGWDDAFRKRVAAAIQDYNEGANKSLPELARGSRHNPKSNHWGMQVGGAAMALLAIRDDPGIDRSKIQPLIEENRAAMIRKMTEGFGDGGYFKEGDGTGSMANIAFMPALQAWRVAGGLDYYTPRPNAQWITLRWFHLTVPVPGQDAISAGFYPQHGGYPHNIWSSYHAYFAVGFGNAKPEQKAAMLWFFNHTGVKEVYEKRGGPYDTSSDSPHLSILALVNWPLGLPEKNPEGIIPFAFRDTQYGHYAWRNRWRDANDTVVSVLERGWHPGDKPGPVHIRSQGANRAWGRVQGGFTGDFAPARDGSTILTAADKSGFAVDFSRASGADAMLVMTGPNAPPDGALEAGGTRFSILVLGPGEVPRPRVEGDKVVVGKQTVGFANGRIALGVFNR